MLRDDKILPFSVVRAPVSFDETNRFVVDGVGYLQVALFSDKTVAAVKTALGDFEAAKVHAFVLDLRQNKGGSFDAAVHTAEQLVPTGATIVTLEQREGKRETFTAKGAPMLPGVPVVVLVDHGTSSGAELLTAALQDGRHAKTVGARTFGKWSVQELEELGNGYAIKYTTALFHAPSGQSFDGVGLAPDVEVDADKDAVDRCLSMSPNNPTARIAADVQLRTALALLRP